MATKRISILSSAKPGLSDECWIQPLRSVAAFSSAIFDHLVVAFDNTGQEEKLELAFYLPDDYAGSPVVELLWCNDATAETHAWRFRWLAIGDGSDVQSGPTVTDDTATDSVSSLGEVSLFTHSLTVDSTFTAGKLIAFNIIRRGNVSTDTQNGVTYLLGARLAYSDT